MLVNRSVVALAAEKFIEKVAEWILIVRLVGIASAAPVGVFDRGFGIDVDYCRFQLLGNLRELTRELLRRGNTQGRCIRALLLLAFYSLGNNRSDKNADGQCSQYR